MGEISNRAESFVRSVFLKQGTPTPASPAQQAKAKRLDRAMQIRKQAIKRRKGM